MNGDDLRQRIERRLSPVYLVIGDARPLVLDAVATIEQVALAKAGLPAFNHTAVRCTDDAPERAIVAARMPPMMGEVRLVVVRELDQGTDSFLGSLVDYLGNPSPTTVLLLTGEGLPKQEKGRQAWGRKLRDAVRAVGEIIELSKEGIDPRAFASGLARSLGKQLDRDAAALLVETVGADLDRIGGEVHKLALYVGSADRIDLEAVRAVCAILAEAEIWDLTAALATGDRARAIEALYRLQDAGDEARRVLSMIAWQARQLVEMSELARSGASDDAIRRVGRMRWETFRDVRPRLEDGIPRAEILLTRLAAANRAMNSHRAGAERVLDDLVLDLLLPRTP